MPRLTIRRLEAIRAALGAMLAGEEGEGDWPPCVTADDLEGALSWACAMPRLRAEKRKRALQRKEWRERDFAEAEAQFAADKTRYFPESPEYLG